MKKFLYILILVIFFFLMSIQTWASLQKSSTDDETIEQAIARLIAVHEGDASSHLGTGESLEQHKMSDIIDHPAQSIVGDKLSAGQLNWEANFETIDGWSKVGQAFGGFPLATINLDYGTVSFSAVYQLFGDYVDWNLFDYECLFTEGVRLYVEGDYYKYMFGFIENGFSPGSYTAQNGFFFEVIDGVLKAVVRIAGNRNDSTISSVNLTLPHLYRAHYVPADSKVYFYIDGVLVASVSKPSGATSGGFGYAHQITFTSGAGGGDVASLYFTSLHLSLNVN